ncbi:MAG: NAD-dependent epimerase/dehydratase family protein [Oscillospiraceae bacterium]
MANKDEPILITGAGGFIGKNLRCRLENEGYTDIMCFDVDTPKSELSNYAKRAAFVFHLAGVNRPVNKEDFYTGNRGLTEELLAILQEAQNKAPILITSSVQAELDNDYGISKKQAEEAVAKHTDINNSQAFIYRLPGVFGKWCRPFYNNVVATFCYNAARGEPLSVRDAEYSFPLVYIDDVVNSFLQAVEGRLAPSEKGSFITPQPVYNISLGHLASLLTGFHSGRTDLSVPNMGDGLTSKLYSTYLSYLPQDNFAYKLDMHKDERGSFTEFLRTANAGQVSVNISKPGIVKGQHWHDSKNEKFLVVKGEGVIRFRKIGEDAVQEYRVTGSELTVVDIPTGYTHNIENTGTEEMITVMWANEPFNKDKPDTYFLKV